MPDYGSESQDQEVEEQEVEEKAQRESAIRIGWLKLPRLRFGFHSAGPNRAALATEVFRCAAAAAALIGETEPDFLRLASDLNELYTCATELGRSTDRHVTSLRETVSETRLIGPDGLAEVLLEGLRSGIAETESELNLLNGICAALLRLVHLGDWIGLTAIFLNTARYSFRVESARTEATRQSFGAFSEELEPLANQVGAVGEAITERAQSAHSELARLVRAIRADSEQLRGVTADTGLIVNQTCRQGQELLDSSFAALQQSGERARQRERHADNAIYHVQFGDIVRQKIEHIVDALREAADALAGSGPGDDRIAAIAQADRVLAIQHAQIELIGSEIRSVQQGLPDAFAGLDAETATLAASLRNLGGGGDSRHSHDGVFEDLKTRLRQLEELEARGRAMRERSRASWKRARETSCEGSRHMDQLRDINFRMHLQSLNAIIKTEWLGEEGRTLGVLSSHMHTMFRESSGLVADTTGVLESISRQTAGSAGLDGADSGDSPVSAGNLRTGLDAGLLAVARVQREFSLAVEAAEEMAIRQASQLERARGSLGFLDTLVARLEDLAEEIRNLRKDLTSTVHGAQFAHGPLSLDGRYTMESEREVHRRHNLDVEPEPVAANPANDLGDNVDFF